jgi:hypothetical protein
MTDTPDLTPEAVERLAYAAETVAGLRILTPEQSEACMDAGDAMRALAAENASLRATRADELARAWEMGRDAGADEYRDGEGPHDYFADAETAIRALRPPADLADRVKGGEG